MTIKQFIEKAIEGGYTVEAGGFVEYNDIFCLPDGDGGYVEVNTFQLLLDPLAWRAVEKAEISWRVSSVSPSMGEYNMRQMLDALIEGKTIEEYIKTL